MSPRSNASPSQRFPRSVRLRTRREFLAVQDRGRKFASAHYMLFALEPLDRRDEKLAAPYGASGRVGFTVSRKVGNAVVRNRVRRWMRESCRRWRGMLGSSDVVIIARPSAATIGYQNTRRELESLLGKVAR